MYRHFLLWFTRPFVVVTAAAFLVLQPVAGPTNVAAQGLTQAQINQFLANPQSLLANNPNGGEQLTATVRDLILADPSTLATIMSLVSQANSDQQASIGAGLGLAAKALADSNPQLASQIQAAVAATGSETLIASYSTASGNTVTAGTPGGDGGGGGGGGVGPTGAGLPSGGGGGGGGTPGNTTSGTGGTITGGGGVSGGGGGGDGTTTVSGSVSPS